jgi:hypothetical protein
MNLCDGCGAEVVPLAVSPLGLVQPFERLMRRLPTGGLLPVPHHCRDYLAWHRPADGRDPFTVDVPSGWKPRYRGAVSV